MPMTLLRLARPALALPFLLLAGAQGVTERPAVAVVTLSSVEAYAQAVRGIREHIPDIQIFEAGDEGRLLEHFQKSAPSLAIAVGSGAAATLIRTAPPEVALVRSVVLGSELEAEENGGARFRSTVTIDVPPDALLAEIARRFPDRKRVGVILGPLQDSKYLKAFEQAARRRGLAAVAARCEHPRDLVEVFLGLRSRADLVWCPPNPRLYNSATLKPLLVASLTNRLPLIGFSEQFVQAGALFGGTADFSEVGRQTATLARRVARNEPVPAREEARKFRFSYNQRVARLLGVRASIPDEDGGELKIFR